MLKELNFRPSWCKHVALPTKLNTPPISLQNTIHTVGLEPTFTNWKSIILPAKLCVYESEATFRWPRCVTTYSTSYYNRYTPPKAGALWESIIRQSWRAICTNTRAIFTETLYFSITIKSNFKIILQPSIRKFYFKASSYTLCIKKSSAYIAQNIGIIRAWRRPFYNYILLSKG